MSSKSEWQGPGLLAKDPAFVVRLLSSGFRRLDFVIQRSLSF
jgi:hypothetical protein